MAGHCEGHGPYDHPELGCPDCARNRRDDEVGDLAEKLFIGLAATPDTDGMPWDEIVSNAFAGAEAFIAERERLEKEAAK